MTWPVEKARPEDASALVLCIKAAYASYHAQGIDLPPVCDGVAEAIADAHVWVVRDGTRIVGGLILSIEAGEAYLENLAVHPDAGGQGLGRRLVDTAIATACAKGCRVIKLTTHAAIPRNVALYEHLGWRVVRSEGNKVAMERQLD